ncbi:MAG: hypothetical protein AAGA76_12670, partial [Pseudomonadota bacterium]
MEKDYLKVRKIHVFGEIFICLRGKELPEWSHQDYGPRFWTVAKVNPSKCFFVTPGLVLRTLRSLVMTNKIAPFIAWMMLLPMIGTGATITWTNGNLTGIWNDAGNWSAGIPGSGDIARFNGTSSADCLIDISVNVSGISITSGYSGTVTQGAGNSITIASGNYVQAGGRFSGGNSSINFNNGTFTLSGGVFTSTSGNMSWDQNVTISGGHFRHNNGTITFDDSESRTINLPAIDTVYNFVMQTASDNKQFTLNAADTLYIENRLTLSNGRLQTGFVFVADSLVMNSGYDDGTASVFAVGSTSGHFLINSERGNHSYFIDKDAANDTVFVENPGGSTVAWGSEQSLDITRGVLHFRDSDANLDFLNLNIRAGGHFVAPSGSASYSGNWNNQGGRFHHNNGSWTWDHNADRTFTSAVIDTFNVLVCSATSDNKRVTLTSGDTLAVQRRLTLSNGQFKTSTLLVIDTLEVISGYDNEAGQSDIVFVGSVTSDYLVSSNQGEFRVIIDKENATDTVHFDRSNGTSLTVGDTE